MSQLTAQFATTLRRAGQNVTAARSCVFAALQNQEPQTMQQVVAQCPSIDRASVYRTVGLFERLGIVERLQQGWKYKLELSDAYHEHHHHATCLRCGTSLALPENAVIEAELQKMAAGYKFQVQRHQLELQGLCKQCRAVPPA